MLVDHSFHNSRQNRGDGNRSVVGWIGLGAFLGNGTNVRIFSGGGIRASGVRELVKLTKTWDKLRGALIEHDWRNAIGTSSFINI